MNKESHLLHFDEKRSPLYASLLTAFIYLVILFLSGIAGFGNRTILSGDLFSQYVAFIQLFLNVLKGKSDFYYSFSLFFGNPAVSTYAYYCLSPFNLLYLIPFFSVSSMTIIVIMLKLSLSAAAFCFFLRRCLNKTGVFPILLGVCYALCSFTVTMQVHIMWLDALYLLPILIYFLLRFVKGGSFLPLTAVYACLFITNFYMGYIFGIFSALCFIVFIILDTEKISRETAKSIVRRTLLYISSVLLAAAICAAVLLPAAWELISQRNSGGSSFSLTDITLPDVFNNLFWGQMQGMGSPIPLIYCGIPMLLLLPVYIASKKIPFKEKLCALAIILFYLAGSQFLPLYRFLHAMDAPNWYAHRYAPCMVFVLLSLACRASSEIKEFSIKTISVYGLGLLLFYAVMIPIQSLIYPSYETNSHGFFILNMIFIAMYILMAWLFKTGRLKNSLSIIFCLLLTVELCINGYTCLSRNNFGYESEETVENWESPNQMIIPELKKADNNFYRIRVNNELCFNSPSFFNYAGLNSFTSTDNVSLRKCLSSLGIGTSFACIYDHGYTEITNMLFGVKYSLNPSTCELSGSSMALPIGFMCSSSLLAYRPSENVFENQQNLINTMTDSDYKFYIPVSVSDNNIETRNMEIMPFDDSILFQHLSDMAVNGTISFSFPELKGANVMAHFSPLSEPVINQSAPTIDSVINGFHKNISLSDGVIAPALSNEEGIPELTLRFTAGPYYDYAVKSVDFSLYDNSQLTEAAKKLAAHPLVLSSWSDTELTGTVESTEEFPLLFTSIPYSEGWEAYIDDAPVQTGVTVDGTFLTLYVSPGVHTIRLVYNHPYAFMSLMISSVAGCLYLLLLLPAMRKKKAESTDATAGSEDADEKA